VRITSTGRDVEHEFERKPQGGHQSGYKTTGYIPCKKQLEEMAEAWSMLAQERERQLRKHVAD
jgi:hypothetical protein